MIRQKTIVRLQVKVSLTKTFRLIELVIYKIKMTVDYLLSSKIQYGYIYISQKKKKKRTNNKKDQNKET